MALVMCDGCLATHSHLLTVVMKTKTQTAWERFDPSVNFESHFMRQNENDK